MPKQTFYNLSLEKQQNLFDACIKEFSQFPYSQASINQIIKYANISRGSFYQYFDDKWDAYEMMIQRIAQEKMKLLPPPSQSNHFFEMMEQFFIDTLQWIELRPDYFKVGLWIDYDHDELIERMKMKNQKAMHFLEDVIRHDQALNLIDSSVNPKDLVDMISEISKTSLVKAYKSGDFELMKHVFFTRLNIIKKGVEPHV